MILAIESGSNICSIAILDNEKLISSINISGKNIHDNLLAHTTQELFKYSKIDINEIKYVSVNIGPGSFTGLRIGLSFAKGLIYGKEIKLLGLISNDILFNSINKVLLPNSIKKIATLISSGNDNFYYKSFDVDNDFIIDDLQIISLDKLMDKLEKDTLIIGNMDEIFPKVDNIILNKDLLAADQLNISKKYIKDENFADLKSIKPLYLNEINYKINN